MKSFLSFLTICFFSAALSVRDNYKVNPLLDVIHFEFNIYVNDSCNIVAGSAAITLKLNGLTHTFELDLKNVDPAGKGDDIWLKNG